MGVGISRPLQVPGDPGDFYTVYSVDISGNHTPAHYIGAFEVLKQVATISKPSNKPVPSAKPSSGCPYTTYSSSTYLHSSPHAFGSLSEYVRRLWTRNVGDSRLGAKPESDEGKPS